MADPRYRSQRSDPYAPDRPSRSAAAAKDDPLAELARLIGQDEAFIAASRQNARPRPQDAGRDAQDNSAPNWLGRTAQRARSGESADDEPEARVRDAAHWAGRSGAGRD